MQVAELVYISNLLTHPILLIGPDPLQQNSFRPRRADAGGESGLLQNDARRNERATRSSGGMGKSSTKKGTSLLTCALNAEMHYANDRDQSCCRDMNNCSTYQNSRATDANKANAAATYCSVP